MLTRLSLKCFKSWSRIDAMRMAPITGLFGTNSSGKSAILQLLMLLKQTKESTDRGLALDFGGTAAYVQLGDFPDVVHGHDTLSALEWTLGWNTGKKLELKLLHPQTGKPISVSGQSLSLTAKVSAVPGPEPVCTYLAYGLDDSQFVLQPTRAGDQYQLEAHGIPGFRFVRTQGRKWPLPEPLKSYAFPDQVRTYHQNADFLSDLELAYEHQMDRIYYLGPLREFPKREYLWSGSMPGDVGRRGEKAVDAILAAELRGHTISRGRGRRRVTLQERVAIWLKELDLIHAFRVEEVAEGARIYRVKVKRTRHSAETLITDVGFGVSQVLPVLVLLYYVPEGATVVLEQPEIHLHPSVQTGLADVFLDAVHHRNIQIIFESHSEHLLLRLQRRVAERGVKPEQVALYFCSQDDGKSQMTSLEMDDEGNIVNWPENFFGNDFAEIIAREKARLQREMRSH